MAKTNYQKILDDTICNINKNGETPVLLLHVCCAPCSSYVLEYLTHFFNIVIFFYNPNISPDKEYFYRLDEVKRLVRELPLKNSVEIIEGDYNPEVFYKLAKGLENLPERSERCQKCNPSLLATKSVSAF
ncbi:MAG: epoxyqueuosine reductase QueH, partial [Ruminococcus sp.]|nr:epoxyqueuosine reductase QueH [Ruminococcus sp.]